MSRGFDYSKFDKIGDSEESSTTRIACDEERKAKREKKRDELIEGARVYKAIEAQAREAAAAPK